MAGPDPNVNQTGVPSFPLKAATKIRKLADGTVTLTTAYQLLMRENAQRKSFDIQGANANTGIIKVQYGTTGPEWEIGAWGTFSRNVKTGNVFSGDLFIKSSVGGDTFIAEEG